MEIQLKRPARKGLQGIKTLVSMLEASVMKKKLIYNIGYYLCHFYKTFFIIIFDPRNKSVFVSCKYFQPSIIFAG
jgi:hypothetical protein